MSALAKRLRKRLRTQSANHDLVDPLPRKYVETVSLRIRGDLVSAIALCLLVFALHASTVFVLEPFCYTVCTVAACIGFVAHYVLPQMRKQTPWLLVAKPLLRMLCFGGMPLSVLLQGRTSLECSK